MKIVNREHIDSVKWDKRLKECDIENIFQYSWYLDNCAENWSAVITDDYKTIMPLPFTKKLGVKRLYPAPFTREYDIIGDDFSWAEVLPLIQKEFAHLSFRSEKSGLLDQETIRSHQYLTLENEFEKKFKTNAKRLIKKGQKQFTFRAGLDPSLLINLFEEYVAHKIDSVKKEDLIILTALMNTALKNEHGELILAYDENQALVAGGFFLKDKKRITYLKGAAAEEAKKKGVMYALFDEAFQRFQGTYKTLDFGGSDIENVATFYRKFGASDRNYYHYELDQTPIWFRTLRKLKK